MNKKLILNILCPILIVVMFTGAIMIDTNLIFLTLPICLFWAIEMEIR